MLRRLLSHLNWIARRRSAILGWSILLLLAAYGIVSAADIGLIAFHRSPLPTSLSTGLAFLFAVLHAGWRIGWRRTILLLGVCFGISLLFESVGVTTGVIFGPYHYTDLLGTKFLGLVPLLIPLARFMMIYPALVIAETLLSPTRSSAPPGSPAQSRISAEPGTWSWSRLLASAAVGGLVMTAWDLVMDPMMVQAGNWVWDGPAATRPYFGIPLQNFGGCWLTTFDIFALYFILVKLLKLAASARSARSPLPGLFSSTAFDRQALAAYTITGLTSILAAALIGLGGPALVGLFGMIPWFVGAWVGLRTAAS